MKWLRKVQTVFRIFLKLWPPLMGSLNDAGIKFRPFANTTRI